MDELISEKGKRFSLVYVDNSSPSKGKQRFRNRITAYYWKHLKKAMYALHTFYNTEQSRNAQKVGIAYHFYTVKVRNAYLT
jgi:hypothetical protein